MVLFLSRRKVLVYRTAALGAGMVAACSSNKSINTSQSPASGEASESGIIATIKSRGKAIVALEAAYQPYEFVQDSKIVGYGPDIQTYISKALGVEVEQLDTPFNGILPGLLAKKFDFVATALNLTEERAKKFALTMPIMQGYEGALVRKNSIKSLDDLSGKQVGTITGSAQEKTVQELSNKLQQSKGQGIETRGFVSIPCIK